MAIPSELGQALFHIDGACIIDGDRTHVTLAIRVPRETIRRHHRLLAALSAAAGGDGPDRRGGRGGRTPA